MAARIEFALLAFVIFISGGVAMTFNSELTGLHNKLVQSKSHHDILKNDTLRTKTVAGNCEYAGQAFPDNINCAVFYICAGTPLSPVEQRCADGELFDPATNRCDPDYVCTTGCNYTTQSIPDPENCASFYICSVTLEAVPVPCGERQFYDIDKQTCADSETVDCTCRPGCLSVGDFIANCNDCRSYYICDNELFPMRFYCPTGQIYDPDTKKCIDGNCPETTTAAMTTPTTTELITTANPTTTTSPTTTTTTTSPTTTTTTSPTTTTTTSPTTTTTSPTTRTTTSPTSTTTTSPTTTTTTSPTTTTTTSTTTTTTTSPTTTTFRPTLPTTGCTEPAQTLPSQRDCTSFYICDEFLNAWPLYCNPSSQLVYDPDYENCNRHSICQPGGNWPTPLYPAPFTPGNAVCTLPGQLFGEPNDCQVFYKCNANRKRDKYKCPSGLSFNPAILSCDIPEAVPSSLCNKH